MQFVARVESTHEAGAGKVEVVTDGDNVVGIVFGGHNGNQYYFVPIFIDGLSTVLLGDALGDELRHVVERIGVVATVEGGQIGGLVVDYLVLFKEGVHVLLAYH